MLERGYGRIVNIASLASFVALFEVAAYAASKAGGGGADAVARDRVGAPRRVRERDRAGRVPHGAEQELLDGTERGREFSMRTPMKRFGQRRGAGGRGRVPGVGRRELRHRRGAVVDGGFLASGVNQ